MEIKDKIISGALKMFTRYGIRSITMDSIAEELGISKRTIYEKFKDKDELLKSCFETAIKTQKASTEEILKNSDNVIEALLKIVKHNVNIMKTINPVFFYDIKKYYPNVNKQTVENNDHQNRIQFMELLDRGKKENVFRSEINVEIVAILLFEQFKIMNNQEVFPEEKYSKIEIFENIVINFMRGIATEKGFSLLEKYNS